MFKRAYTAAMPDQPAAVVNCLRVRLTRPSVLPPLSACLDKKVGHHTRGGEIVKSSTLVSLSGCRPLEL